VKAVAGELTRHPLHAEFVGDLRPLAEDVLAHASEVSGIEHGFEFSRAVGDRLAVLRFGPVLVVRLVAHLRFWGCDPIAAFLEVFLAQFSELSLFEKSTSPGHGCFDYGITYCYEYISRHCGLELIFTFKVGGFDRSKIFFYVDFGSFNFYA